MHLRSVVKREGKFFIEHFVIVDAIDGSDTYYEKLTIFNCWKYRYKIMGYIYWKWKDRKIQRQRNKHKKVS